MTYVYFFKASITIGRCTYHYSGIYQAKDKITGGDSFKMFMQFIRESVNITESFTDKNIIVDTLNFLHEVEGIIQ